jgi:predicted outer membrane repeat protein
MSHRSIRPVAVVILSFWFGLLPVLPVLAQAGNQTVQSACIIYVNAAAAGNGDGTSWLNANPDLAGAVATAPSGCEIWVAQGTYLPGGTRSVSFGLKNNLAVYGGFSGNETMRADRDWQIHPTVLSGDIGAPDKQDDNSYSVISASGVDATAVLDGFTITRGLANGILTGYNHGGGIELVNSAPTLTHLTLQDNSAEYGGGIDCNHSSPILTDSTFVNNTAGTSGGGLYVYNGSSPVLDRVTFYHNGASDYGGAIYNALSSQGLVLKNAILNANQAGFGGGLYTEKAPVVLNHVDFISNQAANGGGITFKDDTSSTLVNVELSTNAARNGIGGGIYSYNSSPTITNVIFHTNTASYAGGGMANEQDSTPILTNVTFYGNSAPKGGGIYSRQSGHPQVRNSIFWEDVPDEILDEYGGNITITYSLVQGCNPSGVWNGQVCGTDGGHNLLDADPLFKGAAGGNFQLQVQSPVINQGNNVFISGVTSDYSGGARIQFGIVDLGPFESSGYQIFLPIIFHP